MLFIYAAECAHATARPRYSAMLDTRSACDGFTMQQFAARDVYATWR